MLHCYSYIHMYILILYLYDVYCWQILQAWQKEIAEAVLVCSIHSSVYKISVSLSTVDTYLCIPSESMKKLHLHYWTLIVTYKTGVIQLQPTLTPSLPLRIQNGGPSEKWITHNIMLPTKTMTFKYKLQKLPIKQFQIWSILIKSKLSRGQIGVFLTY